MASSLSSYPLLTRLVAAAVNISNKSAKILRDVKKSGELNIQEKAANDYVTKADFLSQLNIIKSLEHLFPKLKFCGEEGELKDEYEDIETSFNENVLSVAKNLPEIYNSIKEEDLFVWVDPLDGTKEYTLGPEVSKECTVLIGITWNGQPIAGIMNQPFYKHENNEKINLGNHEEANVGRYLWGIVGFGAYDSVKGKLNPPTVPFDESKTRKIVTTRSHLSDIIKRDLSKIPNSETFNAGGCGYKILNVIEGKADCYLYPSKGCKRWDTCAPEAILRSLNGNLTDVFGADYTYVEPTSYQFVENLYGIVACLNDTNKFYINQISFELKQQLLQQAEKLISEKSNASDDPKLRL